MAFALPASGTVDMDAIHSGGDVRHRRRCARHSRCPLSHNVGTHRTAGAGPGAVRARGAFRHARCSRFCPGAILVFAEDLNIYFRLCLAAWHASPLTVRPAYDLWLEGAAAAGDFERGDHKPGNRTDAKVSFDRAMKLILEGTKR